MPSDLIRGWSPLQREENASNIKLDQAASDSGCAASKATASKR
jgi:hypothetical protein